LSRLAEKHGNSSHDLKTAYKEPGNRLIHPGEQNPGGNTAYPLIGPLDPPPYEHFNLAGRASVLLVADHASRAFPEGMSYLGLDESVLNLHVASDIGSADVTRRLALLLDARAVLAGYSRLIVDCNRTLDDPTAFIQVSDGIAVPANLDLGEQQRELRVRSFYQPYHEAIDAELERFSDLAIVPAFISIHSCTPIFDRVVRPWHLGILWDRDPRIARPLIDALRQVPGVCVGDNEPYSGRDPHDYTIDTHAEPAGLPHVGIEIRQDLIDTREKADHWAGILAQALAPTLAGADLYTVLQESVNGPCAG